MKQTSLINQIEIYKSPVQLTAPFVISLGLLTHAENVLVVIKTNSGITGFGECSPFMTIHGESMDTCFVVAHYLAKGLLHKNPSNIAENTMIMDSIIFGNAAVKSAFDMAMYDIASQEALVPLYVFLGGKNNKQIVTDYTVSMGEPGKMAGDAEKIKAKGFQYVKVKLGGTKARDVERIRLIREAIGNEMPMRIDANQGWQAHTAVDILKALAPFSIQHCEEPIPRWDFMELPRIKRESPVPIMADESCCDHHDAKRLIELHACDMFNVKLSKSGGIFKAQKIIRLAEQAGIRMQAGGFLESRLGFTAAAHLALTSDHIIHYDFDTPLMQNEDVVTGGITYGNKGVVTVPEKPGLGATIDHSYLKRLTGSVIS